MDKTPLRVKSFTYPAPLAPAAAAAPPPAPAAAPAPAPAHAFQHAQLAFTSLLRPSPHQLSIESEPALSCCPPLELTSACYCTLVRPTVSPPFTMAARPTTPFETASLGGSSTRWSPPSPATPAEVDDSLSSSPHVDLLTLQASAACRCCAAFALMCVAAFSTRLRLRAIQPSCVLEAFERHMADLARTLAVSSMEMRAAARMPSHLQRCRFSAPRVSHAAADA